MCQEIENISNDTFLCSTSVHGSFLASKIVTEEEILAVWGKINQNLALMY